MANFPKKYIFRTKFVLKGKCNMCGNCCKRILLKITPEQINSKLFMKIAIKWIEWIFDFIFLDIDYEDNYLAFTCKHIKPDGKCGNYLFRPNVCRNYPIVDYFKKPVLLPDCGYKAKSRK